jgi:hypothetical protein
MTRSIEFTKQPADCGDAPDFIATGVGPMFMVSPSIMRITFVRSDTRHDGVEEQRVSGHMDCDISQVPAINALIRRGLAALLEQPCDAPAPHGSMATH